MEFSLPEDGSALVRGIPIRPFLGVQHNQLDVASVNRMANYAFRVSLENGWCEYGRRNTDATDIANSRDAHNMTTFYAGVEITLSSDMNFGCRWKQHVEPMAAVATYDGRYHVASVGNTSYCMFGDLTRSSGGGSIGTFKVVVVQVARDSRSPVPIPPEKRAHLLKSIQQTVDEFPTSTTRAASDVPASSPQSMACVMSPTSSGKPKVERLSVVEVVRRSLSFGENAQKSTRDPVFPRVSCPSLPSDDVERTTTEPQSSEVGTLSSHTHQFGFHRYFHLRESDIDFNLHVNQLASIRFVIDAFREALADRTTVFHHLLDDGITPLTGDLLIRRLRIDYVREIPMSHKSVDVILFFDDEESKEAVLCTRRGKRLGTLAEVWFLTRGLETEEEPHPFIATAGTLQIAV